MDFELPKELADYLVELDDFIEKVIKPIENADDNIRFFDHRREHARTDWDRDGLPRHEWENLLREMRRRPGRFVVAVGMLTLLGVLLLLLGGLLDGLLTGSSIPAANT